MERPWVATLTGVLTADLYEKVNFILKPEVARDQPSDDQGETLGRWEGSKCKVYFRRSKSR